MNRYVALLRGINVGGNKTVEMKRLKGLLESLGFEDVSTYINSGNVLFETAESDELLLAKRITHAIEQVFGFDVQTIVRTHTSIKHIAEAIPSTWTNDTDQKTDVLFLWDGYDTKKSLTLITATPNIDNLLYIDRAIIWNINLKDYSKSGMNNFIKSKLYKHMTARNCNTVRKLAVL